MSAMSWINGTDGIPVLLSECSLQHVSAFFDICTERSVSWMKVQLQAEKGSESPPEARERKSPPLIQFVRDVSDFWASKRDTGPLVDGSGLHCTATYTGHQGFPLLASTSCCLHECRKTSYYSIRSCFSFRKFLNVSGQEAEGHHKILPHFL